MKQQQQQKNIKRFGSDVRNMNFRNKKKKDEPNQKIHDDDNNNDNFASIIECLELMMGNGLIVDIAIIIIVW